MPPQGSLLSREVQDNQLEILDNQLEILDN
jgi:hypothetical protein